MNLIVGSIRSSGVRGASIGALSSLALLLLLGAVLQEQYVSSSYVSGDDLTYTTASTSTATVTATATTTAASRSTAAGTLSTSAVALGLLTGGLGLASKLDGDLALKDLLAGELLYSTLGLRGGREIDERVADGAIGARVLGD